MNNIKKKIFLTIPVEFFSCKQSVTVVRENGKENIYYIYFFNVNFIFLNGSVSYKNRVQLVLPYKSYGNQLVYISNVPRLNSDF